MGLVLWAVLIVIGLPVLALIVLVPGQLVWVLLRGKILGEPRLEVRRVEPERTDCLCLEVTLCNIGRAHLDGVRMDAADASRMGASNPKGFRRRTEATVDPEEYEPDLSELWEAAEVEGREPTEEEILQERARQREEWRAALSEDLAGSAQWQGNLTLARGEPVVLRVPATDPEGGRGELGLSFRYRVGLTAEEYSWASFPLA